MPSEWVFKLVCCYVILPDFCSYWFFTRGNSSSVVTEWTVNTDGLTGNERTAEFFFIVIAPLYENWIITWGHFTPLLGNKAVPMLCARGQTQTPLQEERHKGATAVQGLCFLWVETVHSASPPWFLCSPWEQFTERQITAAGEGGWRCAAAWHLQPDCR